MAENRRSHSAAFKTRSVAKVYGGKTIAQVAADSELSESMLRLWCKDERYGGKPGPFVQPNGNGDEGPIPLTADGPSKHPRRLIATQFECPHCGGRVTLRKEDRE